MTPYPILVVRQETTLVIITSTSLLFVSADFAKQWFFVEPKLLSTLTIQLQSCVNPLPLYCTNPFTVVICCLDGPADDSPMSGAWNLISHCVVIGGRSFEMSTARRVCCHIRPLIRFNRSNYSAKPIAHQKKGLCGLVKSPNEWLSESLVANLELRYSLLLVNIFFENIFPAGELW